MDWNLILVDIGGQLIPWAATALIALIGKLVYSKMKNEYWKGVAERATNEVLHAAVEVHQTYVNGIKAGREDGKLTAEEQAEAKKRAIETAKANIGSKGVKSLAKIVGGPASVDKWLGTRVESTVGAMKAGPR